MSQYRAAMDRLFHNRSGQQSSFHQDVSAVNRDSLSKSYFDYLVFNIPLLLDFALPILWCCLFVKVMNSHSFWATVYMPFLGCLAAFIANAVPIGGGIVYIPALYLLGVDIKLGVSFTVATMSVGNGILGFLRWLSKGDDFFIWESFWCTVFPSWFGSVVAFSCLPAFDPLLIRHFFALFCAILAIVVVLAVYKGGMTHIFGTASSDEVAVQSTALESIDEPDDLIEDYLPVKVSSRVEDNVTKSIFAMDNSWKCVVVLSFLGGLLLVPNIGIGPAMVTFIALGAMGYPAQRCLVTGIVTGGWVCVVPFLYHVWKGDVPYELWVMVLPGVFFGAKWAPLVHEYIGMNYVLLAFSAFLISTTVLFIVV